MFKSKLALIFLCIVFSVTAKESPNIVLIMADDFGYGSLNCYGASKAFVRTPHIDRLAQEGMKFTDASTPASICTPTRYGLLTGSYPFRSRKKYGVVGVEEPLLLNHEENTIADLLKSQGYNTAQVGKWHLGYGNVYPTNYTKPLIPGPLQLGFDYHWGVPQNHDDKLAVWIENEAIFGLRSDVQIPYSRSFYGKQYMGFDAPQRVNEDVMHVLTTKSVEWIRSQNHDKPFFLYYAPIAVHHPSTPSNEMRGMSDAGPYGDFIQDLDQSVGRIMEALAYKGLLENTMVIFTSDNGGDIPKKRGSPESYAHDSVGFKYNAPLKGDKHSIFEGGTRVPFIVYWKGKVTAGSQSDEMINLVDMYASLAEVVGGNVPKSAGDSKSFASVILGKGKSERTEMITADSKGMLAIRKDGWKYIDGDIPSTLPAKRAKMAARNYMPQLYNLKEDVSETNNLYESNADKVSELKKLLTRLKGADY